MRSSIRGSKRRGGRLARVLRGVARGVLIAVAILVLAPMMAIATLRFVNPPGSMLMARETLAGTKIHYQWMPLQQISPQLPVAVVLNEDPRFCEHWGVDWQKIRGAVAHAENGEPEGTSTIAMQLVKNLFLWPERNYLRKVIEVPLAYFMTFVLPERRIVELYLNIAEWRKGVFGAEAAAQHHFRKSAAALNAREAAQLAAALPNPYVRNAGRPGPKTRALAARIARRAAQEKARISCIL